MTAFFCTIIIGFTLFACVHEIMDKWDDEQRRKHDRWKAEREEKE